MAGVLDLPVLECLLIRQTCQVLLDTQKRGALRVFELVRGLFGCLVLLPGLPLGLAEACGHVGIERRRHALCC